MGDSGKLLNKRNRARLLKQGPEGKCLVCRTRLGNERPLDICKESLLY